MKYDTQILKLILKSVCLNINLVDSAASDWLSSYTLTSLYFLDDTIAKCPSCPLLFGSMLTVSRLDLGPAA